MMSRGRISQRNRIDLVLASALGLAASWGDFANGQGCAVNCPASAATEPEPCGQLLNDGCNLATPTYTAITCGQSVCGTSWADQANRDTDWYTLDVTDGDGDGLAEITATLTSEFPALLFILDNNCIDPQAFAQGQTDNCNSVTINACVTAPGTYRIFVAPGTADGALFEGVLCGINNAYVVSASCADVCTGPANDDCINAQDITEGAEFFSTINATTDGPMHPSCDFGATGDTQVHKDVWFRYTALCTGDLIVDTCNSTSFDTRIAIYDGCACPVSEANLLFCNDEIFGCDGGSSALFVPVVVGQCYLIRIGGFDGQEGLGTVRLSCDPAGLCVATGDCAIANGSPGCQDESCCQTVCAIDQFCCLVDWDDLCAQQAVTSCSAEATEACCLSTGTCIQLTPTDCLATGGTAQGAGTSCVTFTCGGETPQACCIASGVCILTTPSDCLGFGGSPQGAGLACPDVTCLLEACCLPDDSCQMLTLDECLIAGGTPGGVGTDCATTICVSTGTEACCLTPEVCIDADPADCIVFGGAPQGPGTSCATTNCNPCPADIAPLATLDGMVGIDDFLAVLSLWGPCIGCPQDMNGDNQIGIDEFLTVLSAWGPCP